LCPGVREILPTTKYSGRKKAAPLIKTLEAGRRRRMKLVCAECKKVLANCIKGTEGDERISHGLCPACAKMAKNEIQKMSAEKMRQAASS
jgi:hypothetical protein